MKQFLMPLTVVLGAVFLLANPSSSETMYVSDRMKITFRTGPGNDRKIISLLGSDQKVAVIQPEGDWAKVVLPDGKEGWVLQRYLSADVPCRIEIDQIKQEVNMLKSQSLRLQQTNESLNADINKLNTELNNCTRELDKAKSSYENLKKDASHYLELKAKHEKTVNSLSRQTEKAGALEEELTALLRKRNIRWFIAGAGVFLFGFVAGFGSKKQKRRSSLL